MVMTQESLEAIRAAVADSRSDRFQAIGPPEYVPPMLAVFAFEKHRPVPDEPDMMIDPAQVVSVMASRNVYNGEQVNVSLVMFRGDPRYGYEVWDHDHSLAARVLETTGRQVVSHFGVKPAASKDEGDPQPWNVSGIPGVG